ncbi:MAG: zinc-ribbon domain-containing protein, partial [Deltaproteobacteria bacterium]
MESSAASRDGPGERLPSMDVVCERCQTEYDFDDALVSERGTTVKCTNCGHQFKIYRPPTGVGTPAAAWILRRPDGSTVQFESLAVLQKWIADGRVTRSDQLSRNGTDWKTLGSIAELESFFSMADIRNPRVAPASQAGNTTRPFGDIPPPAAPSSNTTAGWGRVDAPMASARAPASAGTPSMVGANPAAQSRANPASNAHAQTMPQGLENYSMGGPAVGPPPSRTEQYALGDGTSPTERWAEGGQAGPTVVSRAPQAARPRQTQEPTDDAVTTSQTAEDLDAVLGRRRSSGGSTGWLIAVGVVLVGAGAGVGIWRLGLFNRGGPTATAVSTAPDRITAAVARAETSTRVATRSAYEDARDQLTAQMASDPDDPRVRAARAQVLALWSESQRQAAEDLDARAAMGGADAATSRAEAVVVRRDVAAGLERARQDVAVAETSAARVPAGAERERFERALGEASRVLGETPSARRHLEAARAAGGGVDVDLLSALLERDANDNDAAAVHLRGLTGRDEVSARAHLV